MSAKIHRGSQTQGGYGMTRTRFAIAVASICLTASVVGSVYADDAPVDATETGAAVQLTGGIQPALLPEQIQSVPAQPVGYSRVQPSPAPAQHLRVVPQTGAPLYVSPQPNIPYQVGGSAITNQALAPHEMLYPHEYRAMYAPFYYVVKGGWVVTPWGVRNNEQWELQGTEVNVKYRSRVAPFSGFNPIRRR